MKLKYEFTYEEHKQAENEGWLLCSTGLQNATHNPYEIQRNDEAGIFKDDIEAWLHVVAIAANDTNSIHAKALRFLATHSPNECEQVINSGAYAGNELLSELKQIM